MKPWIRGANRIGHHTKTFLPPQQVGQRRHAQDPQNFLPTIYPVVSRQRFSDIRAPDHLLSNRLTVQLMDHTPNIFRSVRQLYHRVAPPKSSQTPRY